MSRSILVLLLAAAPVWADENLDQAVDETVIHYQLYLDAGYAYSSNQPANNLWRTKTTTFKLDWLEVNLAMAQAWKEPTASSRWGFEFGLQTGVDTELADPGSDPPIGEAVWNSEYVRYIYRANFSYLLPWGEGLQLTAGLFQGYPAYESFLALENPTYTRGYLTDYVPYFLIGIRGAYPVTDTLDLTLFVVTDYDYLVHKNDQPGYGLQTDWRITSEITYTQNFYAGPEQENTDFDYWRWFSDSVVEYRSEPLVLAASFDIGTEKQSLLPGNPRSDWWGAALWARWAIDKHWWIGCRPEIYSDPDGLMTGARQEIVAFAVTAKYWFLPDSPHSLVACLEYRYDRSTGDGGGFYSGAGNELVPDQHLVILSLVWSFSE